MIKHIVMFKLKDTDGRSAHENALLAKEKADKLPSLVPSLKGFECVTGGDGFDSSNYDIALICEFEDKAGLDAYQCHPDHKAFGSFIAALREENGRACIDFEMA